MLHRALCLLISVLAVLAAQAPLANAYDEGITGQTQLGCTCHGATPSVAVTAAIAGPASLQAGETGTYTVSVSGGPGLGGGFDATVLDAAESQAGTIIVTDMINTHAESGEVTHSHPANRSWSFDWQAPDTPGSYHIEAAANSVNLSDSPGGDEWSFAEPLAVTVTPCTEASERSCGTDLGECRTGTQTCSGGAWGPCTGGVDPSLEVCDTLDNDCDGAVDDSCGGLFCPGGEITLTSAALRAIRKPGPDALATPKNSFVVPEGRSIDLATDPITFYVEADRQPIFKADLQGGSPGVNRSGTVFTYRRDGSSFHVRRRGAVHHAGGRFAAELPGIDPASPPARVKQIVKIGDDCFSSILSCAAMGSRVVCRPERSARLKGTVSRGRGTPLAGVMLTAFDDGRLESVSVFSQEDGRYVFPPLRPGSYRVRARLIGFEDATKDPVVLADRKTTRADLTLAPAADTNSQLPAAYFFSHLIGNWPSQKTRGDFTLACGNCHQIADWRFRRSKTEDEWNAVITRMVTYLPPYFQETRDIIADVLIGTFGPSAPPIPTFTPPPPPSGDVLKAVIYEYGLGDETRRPGCHDLELGLDNVVYADAGVRWINPRTGERGTHPLQGGAHSIERDPSGNMWITQAGEDQLAKMDVSTGTFRYFPLPKIGDDQGAYPHTLRFDSRGRIWFTLTKSNHLAVFDPATEQLEYFRLPPSDPAETGLSVPTAYGCDVAADDTVWYSQLTGQRIGHFDPATETLEDWKPPFYGPRRLHAGRDGIVWVPGYGSGVLGRFDPAIERWKVYDLPTGLAGPPGFGTSELPYSLNANRMNGEVWINGSNSDTMIRFDPSTERFTAFPLPTRSSYTRETEFDPDNNVWTCTSNQPPPDGEGRGKFVKIELPPRDAVCGNRRVEAGEECDDGNANDCDRCSSRCTLVTGCGDGALCGAEACDDGNADDCDGCSSSCELESGLRCGDGAVNAACGEECDPPGGSCSYQCALSVACGNGVRDPGEECDDGNTNACDGCAADCTLETGCGDGMLCGAEECDDGSTDACDGCSPTCRIECGDGTVNCGEECDPPGPGAPECNWLCREGPAPALGTRHLSFGGALYASALGTGTSLGTLEGAFDLVAGAPAPDGVAALAVTGPVYYKAALLGGSFGHMCIRISSCTGIVDCSGGTAVGVGVEQDSAGPGEQGNPKVVTTGLGGDGGRGAVWLSCQQALVQVPAGAGSDCAAQTYPADERVDYTTGTTEGHFLNGDARVGTDNIALSGENFSCASWTVEDGPGKLAGVSLIEGWPVAGDQAMVSLIDD